MFVVSACGGDEAADGTDETTTGSEAATEAQTSQAPADQGPQRLNINTATEAEMLSIPDVGNRMVHEFEEYRPYTSIEQFRREIGKYVDEDQVAAYERYIYVPIDPNGSDRATLQQIPGLTSEQADELIAGRPYASADAFLEALGALVSEQGLAEAERYLSGR